MTDAELLESYRKGNVRAFEILLDRYESALLRYVSRTCRPGSGESAQDVVQEVFLRLLEENRPVENPSAWLFRVAHNVAVDVARKETRMDRRNRSAAGVEAQVPQDSEAERREVNGIVTEKLLALPPNQRDVLILKVQEGRSYREISEITGLSASNVGYLVHHGLKALAMELRKAGVV